MIAMSGGSVGGYYRYECQLLDKIVSLKSEDVFGSGVSNFVGFERKSKILGVFGESRLGFSFSPPLKAIEVGCSCFRENNKDGESGFSGVVYANGEAEKTGDRVSISMGGPGELKANADEPPSGTRHPLMATVGKSTNIVWQECSVGQDERQKLLNQKGCVIWITGLSGSGKSTMSCALSQQLHARGKLSYILDGDNLRHGLNRDLSFKPEDRAENIRRVGEVAKLFADAGIICIASLISPYKKDRDACRALLPGSNFIEVFLNVPLEVCEARDAKGLYKLARAGKIKGFTGIDDPYEAPLNCEITLQLPVKKGERVSSVCESSYMGESSINMRKPGLRRRSNIGGDEECYSSKLQRPLVELCTS